MWLFYITIVILTIYCITISIFYVGWKRIPYSKNEICTNRNHLYNLSVIVACKNEEKNIGSLIKALLEQTHSDFELIFVNDHSTDKTVEMIENSMSEFKNVKLISALGFGKKNALKEGILFASSDLIVTTDADCIPKPEWLQTLYNFQCKNNSDLLIGPVQLIENPTIFSKIQSLEFISLIISGAGAAGVGMPIMCNGANLAFKREAWLKSQYELHENEQSGDDIFMLQSVKRKNGNIKFLKSEKAIVMSNGAETLATLLKQRRRWTAKAGSYSDWQTIFVAMTIFCISIVQLILLLSSVINFSFFYVFALVFVIKLIFDTLFLFSAQDFFKIKNILINSFLLSMVYPFYIAYVTLSTLFLPPRSWK